MQQVSNVGTHCCRSYLTRNIHMVKMYNCWTTGTMRPCTNISSAENMTHTNLCLIQGLNSKLHSLLFFSIHRVPSHDWLSIDEISMKSIRYSSWHCYFCNRSIFKSLSINNMHLQRKNIKIPMLISCVTFMTGRLRCIGQLKLACDVLLFSLCTNEIIHPSSSCDPPTLGTKAAPEQNWSLPSQWYCILMKLDPDICLSYLSLRILKNEYLD